MSKFYSFFLFNFWCTEITAINIGRINNFLILMEANKMAIIVLIGLIVCRLGMDAVDIQEGRV